jgi:putative copper export protein
VLLKRPSAESRAFFDASFKPVSILMGASGGLTFLTGLLRGTVFGQIKTMADLSTPYGVTFLVAAILMVFMLFHGPRNSDRLLKAVWDGKKYRKDAAVKAKSILVFSMSIAVILLLCMALMHFGL